ncbi:hypothetical protein [Paenibacillus gansuensis]|uniref:Sodium:solute symporter n=1 Tax=Paenibacillus gansuensis TaxID=306542 RepID=A0ABW5P8W4_9BACL
MDFYIYIALAAAYAVLFLVGAGRIARGQGDFYTGLLLRASGYG